jgi:hypothetical protein
MSLQYTPCNISTPLTYLITCLAFPDLASNSPKRVKLVQNALKSFDEFDSHEGPYTGDFTRYSGLNNAIAVRSEMMEIKAECLFDLLTFCTFRAKFEHAEKVFHFLVPASRYHCADCCFAVRLLLFSLDTCKWKGFLPLSPLVNVSCSLREHIC